MKSCTPALAKAGAWLGAGALLLGLSACSGGSGDSPAPAEAAASAPVLTQSTITLPSSVQVVTAN